MTCLLDGGDLFVAVREVVSAAHVKLASSLDRGVTVHPSDHRAARGTPGLAFDLPWLSARTRRPGISTGAIGRPKHDPRQRQVLTTRFTTMVT
jgi:hypothetical protein